LQLNAEEFAPPPNIYDAAEEPRPDDAWVKFYGGETRGGVKRLSSLDDEADTGQTDEGGAGAPNGRRETPPAPDVQAAASPRRAERLQAPSRPQQDVVNKTPSASPTVEVPLGLAPSPVREFPREVTSLQPDTPQNAVTANSPVADYPTAARAEELRVEVGDASLLPTVAEPFETWLKRWSPWLKRGGSVKVCRAFFDLTHGRGSSDCFTSNSAIMEVTRLSRAQCIRNIHHLIEMGFLEELGASNNKEAKGTYYRFHLVPRFLNAPQ
jgi:hypothetical protein